MSKYTIKTEGETSNIGQSSCIPEDKNNTVAKIFFLYGIGVRLPWNAVSSCLDFFTEEMKDPIHNYQPNFVYPFGVNGLNSFMQAIMIIYGC